MRPLGFPRERKNAISVSIAFSLDFLIRNENVASEECKTKDRLKYLSKQKKAKRYIKHKISYSQKKRANRAFFFIFTETNQ